MTGHVTIMKSLATWLVISLFALILLFAIGRATSFDDAPTSTDDSYGETYHVMLPLTQKILSSHGRLFEIGYTGPYDECLIVWEELAMPGSIITQHKNIVYVGTLTTFNREVNAYELIINH